jgi:hypothetical protein
VDQTYELPLQETPYSIIEETEAYLEARSSESFPGNVLDGQVEDLEDGGSHENIINCAIEQFQVPYG